LFLILRGTPAAVDDELDPVACGVGCSLAQGGKEGGIKVGYGRKIVIEDGRAVGDGTVRFAKRTTVLAGKDERTVRRARRVTVLAVKETLLTVRDVGG
jgi:hypothetical protein